MGKILEFAEKHNICFVSNGWEDELFLKMASFFGEDFNALKEQNRFEYFIGQFLSSYSDDRENYQSLNLFYGKKLFEHLMTSGYFLKKFKIIIYLDEDCFIYDWDKLFTLIEDFELSKASLLAPLDGGTVCHRMQCNEIMPNTFLFAFKTEDVLSIRDKVASLEDSLSKYKTCKKFCDSDWYKYQKVQASIMAEWSRKARAGKENLYAKLVYMHDTSSFPYTKKLVINDKDVPYSVLKPEMTRFNNLSIHNYDTVETEPYYQLFYLLMSSGLKLMYIPITDLYKDKDGSVVDDYGGVCSQLFSNVSLDSDFCVHTWISRIYINDAKFRDNYIRINKIYDWAFNRFKEAQI